MLTRPHCPLDVTPTLPPISSLITPYASTPLPLAILMLPRCPQDIPPMPPSRYVSYAVLNPPYASSSLPLTIPTLA
ncbi:hypothetical protein O181_068610 [Austropuccinia psidii MF-1]|uniref:Uncharacterized protein n=1 Tax=Austropuccinia psidii MF-1 TaxID=1389203 RepID=A0A9Q3I783_9BASI|nr:hypothetical protein [Austropuccinia psidii MF-1]